MNPDFYSPSWCDLIWTPWVRLDPAGSELRTLPTGMGVYRVRPIGGNQLAYIGQTGRSLRERLRDLGRNACRETMPFNDPHTVAPGLWACRIAVGMAFECSVAEIHLDGPMRRGLEDRLLWWHRTEFGQSTLCNYGRFHPLNSRPGNRGSGRAGERLPKGQTNPAAGPSSAPLRLRGKPGSTSWMNISWSPLRLFADAMPGTLPTSPGLYRIIEQKTGTLLYVGESRNLLTRLQARARADWWSGSHLPPSHPSRSPYGCDKA